jgi:hypothetical protein
VLYILHGDIHMIQAQSQGANKQIVHLSFYEC